MANIFDQFDPPSTKGKPNVFDQFDEPSRKKDENESDKSKALRAELSGMTQSPAYARYDQLPEWQKAIVAAGDQLSNYVDFPTLGFKDEIAAGIRAPFTDRSYAEELEEQERQSNAAAKRSGWAGTAMQLAGGIGLAREVGRRGYSYANNAAARGGNLNAVAKGSALDTGIVGSAYGAGSGEGLEDRAIRGAVGGLGGYGAGYVTPYALSALQAVGGKVAAPVMAWLQPEKYADKALNAAARRSGMTPQQVEAELLAAQEAGQPYIAADAMGNAGQRLVSAAARTPHDERQALVEMLDARQANQGRRLAGFIDDGFASAEGTAAQRAAAERVERRAMADLNYGEARKAAGAVDTSSAIQMLDEQITPGVTKMIGSGADDGGVFSTLAKARGYLTDGKAQVSDFDRAFAAKVEMDGIIRKGGPAAELLRPARNALDDALASSSKPYANARDTYRRQSQAIEAIDTGRQAAKRGRFEDTIPAFQRMSPEAQAGFRTGYADPLIEATQGAAVGVNKARPLVNDATAQEFPAFAVPGRAQQLQERIGREMRMFETRGAATGGSRTADNLADMADLASFDPSIVGNLFTGNIPGLLRSAAQRGSNMAQGMPKGAVERIARALMETNPAAARAMLERAAGRGQASDRKRMIVEALLRNLGIPMAMEAN